MKRRVSGKRPGFKLVELLVVVVVLAILIGLFFTSVVRIREASPRTHSQNNLKQIAIALNNFADVNNNRLPNVAPPNAPFFFCGQTGGTATRGGQPSSGPVFQNGLLSFMEGYREILVAPLDPNLGNASIPGSACSYSIPAAWTLVSASGTLTLPESFPRGASQCIAAAEMTTQDVCCFSIVPFALEPFTPAVANTPSTTANCFSPSGCHVAMVDGSVHNVAHAANLCGDFVLAQQLDDLTAFSPNW
jgi:type II secretory pathway pseudopilin PulG